MYGKSTKCRRLHGNFTVHILIVRTHGPRDGSINDVFEGNTDMSLQKQEVTHAGKKVNNDSLMSMESTQPPQ